MSTIFVNIFNLIWSYPPLTSVIHSASSSPAPSVDNSRSRRSNKRPWTNLLFRAINFSRVKVRWNTFFNPVYWSWNFENQTIKLTLFKGTVVSSIFVKHQFSWILLFDPQNQMFNKVPRQWHILYFKYNEIYPWISISLKLWVLLKSKK